MRQFWFVKSLDKYFCFFLCLEQKQDSPLSILDKGL